MKKILFKGTLTAALLFGAISINSCKDKTAETEAANEAVADSIPEGMSSAPHGDTIVRKNDTIVEMGTENDTKVNPVGKQVP